MSADSLAFALSDGRSTVALPKKILSQVDAESHRPAPQTMFDIDIKIGLAPGARTS